MKEDEEWLLRELYKEHLKKPEYKYPDNFMEFLFGKQPYKMAREIIEEQEKYNKKRLWYVMEKFNNKGLLDYGTSLASAWLTDKGIEKAKELC